MNPKDIKYIEQVDKNTFKLVYTNALVDFISRRIFDQMDKEGILVKWKL